MLTLQEILDDFASQTNGPLPSQIQIDSQNQLGETALHWMATLGDENAIALLIEAGAYINATDLKGNTPLHHAVSARQHFAAKKLTLMGADVSASNSDNHTPADIAELDGYEPCLVLFRSQKD